MGKPPGRRSALLAFMPGIAFTMKHCRVTKHRHLEGESGCKKDPEREEILLVIMWARRGPAGVGAGTVPDHPTSNEMAVIGNDGVLDLLVFDGREMGVSKKQSFSVSSDHIVRPIARVVTLKEFGVGSCIIPGSVLPSGALSTHWPCGPAGWSCRVERRQFCMQQCKPSTTVMPKFNIAWMRVKGNLSRWPPSAGINAPRRYAPPGVCRHAPSYPTIEGKRGRPS